MEFTFVPQAQAQCANTGQGGINLGDCLTLKDGRTVSSVEAYQTPAGLTNLIVTNIFLLSGVLIFLSIFFAGFKFITGDAKGKDESRTLATGAVIGFIVMFSAFWIIQVVEMITGANIIF